MKKITLTILFCLVALIVNAQTTVNCGAAPVNTTYCYVDFDTTSWVFTSSDGSNLNVVFNAGQVENNYDELVVTDSDGTVIYNDYGNNGNLTGLTFQSSGDTITIAINADFTINCNDNGYTPWDFDVSCSTCANPVATYTVVDNCDTGGGFLIDVDVTDVGSANSLTISDNQSSPNQTLGTAGSVQFGPYANGTPVEITVANDQDVNCVLTSGTLTQSNCPPPPPVGVTCGTGSSVFLFTEDFDTPGTWTGDLNSSNGSWEIPDDSTSPETGPSGAYNGSNFMNFEASGNTTATASAVSPAIDLTNATDGAELSFFVHAYGSSMGTLNVNVGNSTSGPFTTVFTLSGELQTSESEPWLPVGVDLSAYLGQVIYLEFSHTGAGGYRGDMSIDFLRVETCGSFCIAPSGINATGITETEATISWTANSGETAWEYVVQPSGTGLPTGSGTATSSTTVNLNALTGATVYEVYVRAICGSDQSIWSGPYGFSTTLPPPPAVFTTSTVNTSGSQRAAVDMNGDFLDDVVSITANNINIFYQQATGGLSNTAVNIGTTSANFTPSWSLAAADYDKNGFNDLLYGGGSGVTFMRANATGTAFTEISGSEYVFSQRSNFVDINNDGHLDAFVCHDVQANVYYINDGTGDLTFYQGQSAGVLPNGLGLTPGGGNYGTIWIDFDNDRDMDMFIAKCRGGSTTISTNELWRNDGNGVFVNIADSNSWYNTNYPGVGHNNSSNLGDNIQTWSAAWGDFDNDGDMDVFVGASSTANGTHKLMRNNGDGTFTDVTGASGILPALTRIGIENATYDFDNDGNLDIATNGSVLFGNGNMTFGVYDNVLASNNGSFGDLNNDGFIDAISGTTLYTNTPNGNNWITINTVGTASNINGIGARIEITTPSGTQIRDVRSGEGFRFMSTLNTHFGLGSDTTINQMVIYWPSGTVDTLIDPAINTTHNIVEGSTLSIEDETLLDLTIYPNPADEQLTIQTTADLTDKVATIFDITGRKVTSQKLQTNQIDVSYLGSGVYFLRLESNGRVMERKFIKK